MVMPAAPIVMSAPVTVVSSTCCAALSESVMLVPVLVCRWMFGVTGVAPASASGGKPPGSGQNAPLHTG